MVLCCFLSIKNAQREFFFLPLEEEEIRIFESLNIYSWSATEQANLGKSCREQSGINARTLHITKVWLKCQWPTKIETKSRSASSREAKSYFLLLQMSNFAKERFFFFAILSNLFLTLAIISVITVTDVCWFSDSVSRLSACLTPASLQHCAGAIKRRLGD